MASGRSGVPPDVAGETHTTPTSPTDTSGPRAGVPADSQTGKDTLKAEGGKSV